MRLRHIRGTINANDTATAAEGGGGAWAAVKGLGETAGLKENYWRGLFICSFVGVS